MQHRGKKEQLAAILGGRPEAFAQPVRSTVPLLSPGVLQEGRGPLESAVAVKDDALLATLLDYGAVVVGNIGKVRDVVAARSR